MHQDAGELRVNLFIRAHVAVAEVEERLPVDEPTWRTLPASQIIGIGLVWIDGIVEGEGKKWRAAVRAEIQPVTRSHLRMSEAIRRNGKLDRDQRIFPRVPELIPQ